MPCFAPMRARVPATPLAERAHPQGDEHDGLTNTQSARATPAALLALLLLAGTAPAGNTARARARGQRRVRGGACLTLTPGDGRRSRPRPCKARSPTPMAAAAARPGGRRAVGGRPREQRPQTPPPSPAARRLGAVHRARQLGQSGAVSVRTTTHEGNVLIALAKGNCALVTGLIIAAARAGQGDHAHHRDRGAQHRLHRGAEPMKATALLLTGLAALVCAGCRLPPR